MGVIFVLHTLDIYKHLKKFEFALNCQSLNHCICKIRREKKTFEGQNDFDWHFFTLLSTSVVLSVSDILCTWNNLRVNGPTCCTTHNSKSIFGWSWVMKLFFFVEFWMIHTNYLIILLSSIFFWKYVLKLLAI